MISESKARPILVWRDPIETVPPGAARLGIETVFSMADALRRVEEMVAAPSKPGLVSRLRNVMGI